MILGQEGGTLLKVQTVSGTTALVKQCQAPWSNKTLPCDAVTAQVVVECVCSDRWFLWVQEGAAWGAGGSSRGSSREVGGAIDTSQWPIRQGLIRQGPIRQGPARTMGDEGRVVGKWEDGGGYGDGKQG
jgi:hypothetical protein